MKEQDLFNQYLKDWCELYVHFCWHKNETPKQAWDRNIFKAHFTFERWKQGFTKYTTHKKSVFSNRELEGVELKDNHIKISYNMFHFVPFNINFEL